MAGKGDGEGEGNILKLENQIAVIKYVMLFMNVLAWIIGAATFALCLWLRFEPGIQEWIYLLNASQFYIGCFILIFGAVVVMIVSFVGCLSALQENAFVLLLMFNSKPSFLLSVSNLFTNSTGRDISLPAIQCFPQPFIGTQALCFVVLLAGSAVLLDNSARESHFQPRVRESMRQLIMNQANENSKYTLAMIQEGIGCCGADGPMDYLNLQQPLPTECRDTVTGNPFFHGCVDELTWFFEVKCAWIAALAMIIAFINVVNVVLSIVLIQALKKEEEQTDTYRK